MVPNPANVESSELYSRLVTLRPILEVNGTIVLRKERNRHPSYRLRYRSNLEGRLKQSAIVIPAPQVDGVKRLIEDWRKEVADLESGESDEVELPVEGGEKIPMAKFLEMERGNVRKCLRESALGSRGTYRRWCRQYEQAVAEGPSTGWKFYLGLMVGALHRGKPGRPRKGWLTLPGWK